MTQAPDKAKERLSQISTHLKPDSQPNVLPGSDMGKDVLLKKSPDDVVVTCAIRSPFTKAGKGQLKDTMAADLLAYTFENLISKSKIDPNLVEDIVTGCVLAPGGGATEYRAAALAAGFPDTTAVKSLNRQCSSGLQACVDIANQIKTGMIEIGIGSGVESMSTQYGPGAVTEFSDLLENHMQAANCKVPMGVLSEQMAKDRKVTRADQDAFAASSYQKAVKAQEQGLFDEEIMPVTVKYTNPKTDEEKTVTVTKDDGVRPGITAESLSKIRAAFAKDGSIHAGNASQVTDGASAVLLMKRSTAERLGQTILGKFVNASVVGVPPLLMGIGPWKAIPVVLEKAGISKDDVDIYEINEAFASQCVWCLKELGLDEKKVNPKGGAIAFGHPLGCTGARQVGTLLTELRRTGQKIGVSSMCVGTGMGMAAVWVAE
ncbi:3-ketoacyl-CoA thiolase with broad chain length specificity [Exophiala xenobiotica]|uniref:acetyl-CoA C-acyltransferase n=1 Tax=Lithohypha guttulata TaxID=1690604 RepID=A0ABR0KLN7_9EURO|nr:3-ketoacyl-CoA thiolase with broad chain length specificity [Lithohypha guttulata]KAK5323632.1 3-ketoacyl-CoA thiolase with broad chain length specificity [Exophiala xenobiotica]